MKNISRFFYNHFARILQCGLLAASVMTVLRWGRVDLENVCAGVFEWVYDRRTWVLVVGMIILMSWLRLIWHLLQGLWKWTAPHRMLLAIMGLFVFVLFWQGYGQSTKELCLAGVVLLGFLFALNREPAIRTEPAIDHLNRKYFANRLAEIFTKSETTVHRVAIMGAWGTGKTTVLRLLQDRLNVESIFKFRIAIVNPWKAQTPEEAWAIMAKGFDEALNLPSLLSRTWADHPFFSWIIKLSPFAGISADIIKIFVGEPNNTKQALLQKVNRTLNTENTRTILLVDDMERTDPKVLRSMFHVIDQLAEFENCFFVFAIDPERVADAFGESKTNEPLTKGYLDKVFDLQIQLPEPRQKDVASMIASSVNKEETPKLAEAIPKLFTLISTNPRLAISFLEDVKNKELLFLDRYGHNERNFYSLFVLSICESEFRGFTNAILEWPKVMALFTAPFARGLLARDEGNVSENQILKELTPSLLKRLNIVDQSPQHDRLVSLIQELVKATTSDDLKWSSGGYTMLLELSRQERDKLAIEWVAQFGQKSILAMLETCFGEMKHCEPVRCASQLLEFETKEIKNISTSALIKNFRNIQEDLSEAIAKTNRLRGHLQFAISKNLEFDLALYREELFLEWLNYLNEVPLEQIDSEPSRKLQIEGFAFHTDIASNMSAFQCWSWARYKLDQAVNRYPRDGERREIKAHCERIRRFMFERVTDVFADAFRDGSISESLPSEFEDKLENDTDSLSYPNNWLWTEDDEWKKTLSELSLEARSNPKIAMACASLASMLFLHPLSCNDTGHGHTHARKRVAELAEEDPEYLRFFWETAMMLPPSNEVRQQLLLERERATKMGGKIGFVDIAVLDRIFPLPHENDSM
jgi:hypothetical protein